MYCPRRVSHMVSRGESLYGIAKYYNTTVDIILLENPFINPLNLLPGTILTICPNSAQYSSPQNIYTNRFTLSNMMRNLWQQHVFWTRLLIISIIDNLKDRAAVRRRLLQNPAGIAKIFQYYYGDEVAKNIETLLTEHLAIAEKLVTALKNNDTKTLNEQNKLWYQNADKIADYLPRINPYYKKEELQKMLHEHLDLVKKQAIARNSGNFDEDVTAFDNSEKQALKMSDYFIEGIVNNFQNIV